jgi:hypothetical protein
MSPAAGIGTERDMSAIKTLESISSAGKSRDELFDILRNAKMDPLFWEELSAADTLRMDYKRFSTGLAPGCGVGIASVLQPISRFISKMDVRESVSAAICDQNLNGLVVMSFVHHPVPTREVLICSPSSEYTRRLSEYLCSNEDLDFQMSAMGGLDVGGVMGSGLSCAVFRQGHVKASRKQMAPAIQKFEDSATFDYNA